MPESCTILGSKKDYTAVLDLAMSQSSASVGVVEGEGHWKKITVQSDDGWLILNSLEAHTPGDEMSKLLLGMSNYFNKVNTQAETSKKKAIELIGSCVLAIGITAEPAFSVGQTDLILKVASAIDGVLFNGYALLDSDGVEIFSAYA